jgi:predicted ATPase/DNA-binding SARP family transcriptional activator/class 3 adenylate cyclase/Tfp pilus assembly protein PilF
MSESQRSPLTLRLFGPIEVLLDGSPLPRLRGRKGLWLLALLALRHPRPVDRDWLAGVLWPESDVPQMLASLRKTLTDLRSCMGAQGSLLVSPTPRSLALEPDQTEIDVVAFDKAVRAGDTASLREAVALYRGPLLEGCAEEWVFQEREWREQSFFAALEQLSAQEAAAHNLTGAVGYLRRALAADPLRESTRRALMETLADSGDTQGALEIYQEYRSLLYKESGDEPGPELRALFQQIRTQARSAPRAGAGVAQPPPTAVETPPAPPSPVVAPSPEAEPLPAPSIEAEEDEATDRSALSDRPEKLPDGTVTYLFTDIEHSTRLVLELGDRWGGVLEEHHRLLREAWAAAGGYEVRTMGDAFFVVFTRADAALAAAVQAQRAVESHPWPEGARIRVRMGLHTAAASLVAGDYVGVEVHRAHRISSAGKGGQILLSQTTRTLLGGEKPFSGVELREWGKPKLKDLPEPEPLFQAVIEGHDPGPGPPEADEEKTNLPSRVSRFIGREPEIEELRQRLAETRLLTLTGAGGMGKSRLSVQVGRAVLEEYADGVWLVELVPLPPEAQSADIVREIARVLNVREQPGRGLSDVLVEELRPKRLLLILDNCEHLVAAAAEAAHSLLQACPQLRVLATSREQLAIPGEIVWPVPSLTMPDLDPSERTRPGLAAALAGYESVQLFVDRAHAIKRTFTLTDDNATAVARLCRELDGMPLAIELAAAQMNLLPVEKIVERLHDRFRLLVSRDRTEESRRKTLRAVIDWSYNFLLPEEQALLQRLSVFAGGFTWEAVAAVCPGDPVPDDEYEILGLLHQLQAKSLVVADSQEEGDRYRLLETIRQYAAEILTQSGQDASLRLRHRDWYLEQALQAQPELRGATSEEWLDRLEAEHDNLRAALVWSVEQNDVTASLRFGGALYPFWAMRGYLAEGRERLARVLSLPGADSESKDRARVLHGAGLLARWQGEYEAASTLLTAGLQIYQSLEDPGGRADALFELGQVAWERGDYEEAGRLYQESLLLQKATGDRHGMARSLHALGNLSSSRGDHDAARTSYEESLAISRSLGYQPVIADSLYALGQIAAEVGEMAIAQQRYEESLALWRSLGHKRGRAMALNALGSIALDRGDHESALCLLEQSLDLCRKLGDRSNIPILLYNLGHIVLLSGDVERAETLLHEGLRMFAEQGNSAGTTACLEDLGQIALQRGELARSARLFGSIAGLDDAIDSSATSPDYEDRMAAVRAGLGDEVFAAEWQRGLRMTLEEAVAEASSIAVRPYGGRSAAARLQS